MTVTFVLISGTHRELRPALIRFCKLLPVFAFLYGGCYVIFQIYFHITRDAYFQRQTAGSRCGNRVTWVFVWPAVGITASALLMRLPTRPVRIACIFFVLSVNLVMAGMRMFIGTEPPIDKLAQDVWNSQNPKSDIRTFYFIHYGDIAVAGTSLSDNVKVASGRYYLQMLSDHQPMSPDLFETFARQLQSAQRSFLFARKTQVSESSPLSSSMSSCGHSLHLGKPLTFDPYRKMLTGWKLVNEQVVYDPHLLGLARVAGNGVRREYVRK